MPVPNYVIQALAEVREDGRINMLDRRGVTALVSSPRAYEWLEKASNSQYMEALNEMGRAESEDFLTEGVDEEVDEDLV